MKKKGWLLLGLIAMLAFSGCGKDGTNASGQETATPKPTATPVPAMTPEQIALATDLREVYKDEVSAKIVERGYFYEVNRVAEDENYRIEFKAVTGDMEKPKLVMDAKPISR